MSISTIIEYIKEVLECDDHTLFLTAVQKNKIEIVKILVNETVNGMQDDALILAAKNGYTEIVKILLDAGIKSTIENDLPLRWASENGHIDIVKILLDAGANVHAMDNLSLRFASKNGHIEIVKILLLAGAEHDQAIKWAKNNGHIEIERILNTHMQIKINEQDIMMFD